MKESNKYIKQFKKAFFIRKTEELFLELFREGKISGTVHTCIGQEFTGIFASEYSVEGDFVVTNHRGHGHYLSFTKDYEGLINELLGNSSGCSKGIGGSQHLYNKGFLSNGIQGGMLPIAAGVAYSNKLKNKNNISIAFLGDGTLGEGIVYETLNICSLWRIPIVFILEKNNISQSTSFEQNFSGDLKSRIEGFGIEYQSTSIYSLEQLDEIVNKSITKARTECQSIFLEVEVGRLNSHSKGDDNRDPKLVEELFLKDPLNIFLANNKNIKMQWEVEINLIHKDIITKAEDISSSHISSYLDKSYESVNFDKAYNKINSSINNDKRFNDLIYDELKFILTNNKNSFLLGEDIENWNDFNPLPYGGAFKVTKDLSNLFPLNVRNTPISEQAITGIGIGMALNGDTSIVEIMFGDFSTLVLDQLLQHVSKFTLMYGRELEIPFIIRTPMGGFRGYGPTHSQSLEKHFLGIPGLEVIALNQLIHPQIIFNKIISNKKPVLLIENKILYTKKLYENLPEGYEINISESEQEYPIAKISPIDGEPNVSIVCYGGIINEVLISSKELFTLHEILVEIFVPSDLNNSLIPGLDKSLKKTGLLCIIQEGNSYGSFGSEVIARLLKNNIQGFDLINIANNLIIPSSRNLEEKVLPTSRRITNLILNGL
jgi:2-oxoisovalerate dehydrogenase E1 component